MPTAQRRKRNNILETQGHGKVYCFKANDTFREKIMLKAHFLMISQEWQRIRSQWKETRPQTSTRHLNVSGLKRGLKKRAKESGCSCAESNAREAIWDGWGIKMQMPGPCLLQINLWIWKKVWESAFYTESDFHIQNSVRRRMWF